MIQKILEKIDASTRILVASHASPDGDALASTLAFFHALRNQGKEVFPLNVDGAPEPYDFLPGADSLHRKLPSDDRFDIGFVLDAGELARVGADIRAVCDDLVNIDHHPYSETFGSINWVDEKASATGAMIYRLIKTAGWEITLPIAVNLYTAVISDTGSFRYSNADPEAFSIGAEMVRLGVDPWNIASGLYENQPPQRLKLLGLCLATLTISTCGRYASVSVTTEMYRQSGGLPEHTDRFVNYPRSIQGVEVAIFFRQVGPDQIKAGFRSKGKIDVGALARKLGGGGHHNAAGAVLSGTLEAVQKAVFQQVEEILG